MAIFSYAALGAQVKVSVLLKTVKLSVMGEQTWASKHGRAKSILNFVLRFDPLCYGLPLHFAKRYQIQRAPARHLGFGRILRTGSGGFGGGAIGSKLDFLYSYALVS